MYAKISSEKKEKCFPKMFFELLTTLQIISKLLNLFHLKSRAVELNSRTPSRFVSLVLIAVDTAITC